MNTIKIRNLEFSYQQLLNLLNTKCPFNKTFYYSECENKWFSVNHEDDNTLVIYNGIEDLIKSVENYVDNYFMPLEIIKQVPNHLNYTMQIYYNDETITYYDVDGEHVIPNNGGDIREQISNYLDMH